MGFASSSSLYLGSAFSLTHVSEHLETKTLSFRLSVDTPGPAVNFTFEEVRKNSVICKWDPPLDDGGSEILNYTLEKKDNSKLEIGWSCVTSTLRGCRYLVPKLIEKKEYLFRVVAENKYGAGPPCVSKPLIAKNPFGTAFFCCVF